MYKTENNLQQFKNYMVAITQIAEWHDLVVIVVTYFDDSYGIL